MTGDGTTPSEDHGLTAGSGTHSIGGASVSSLWKGLLLAGLLFLPGLLGFLFEGTSFTTGTALVCLVALMLAGLGVVPLVSRDVQIAFATTGIITFIVILHLLISSAIDNDPGFDIGRALLSLLLFSVVAVSVPAFSIAIMADYRIRTIVRIMFVLFIISALLSLLKIQPPTSSLGEKPTFPFTEPSFLGFSLASTLIFTMMRSSRIVRALLILIFIGLGFGLSNLTIIVTCIFAAAITLPVSWLILGVTVSSIGAASLDLSYYSDRLDFNWATSTNLSSLVYVQGWQMLQESLLRTHGWGIGFQQLGVVYTNVPASIRINALLGRDANLQDGGFILSKLGSEFGLLGFGLVGVYLYVMGQSFMRLRLAIWRKTEMADGELFAHACVLGYFVEMFIRGTNYFTGTLVLMLAGLVHLRRMGVSARR
jgi:hypothetical protein